MEITNHRLLQFCRWLLLLICLSGGGFLLLGGKSRGFGILLLLIGFWFVLDNPLDSLENLEGSCPFCGHKVQTRRGLSFRCPACAEKTVIVDSEISYFEDIRTLSDLYPRSEENVSQVEPVDIEPGDSLDLHVFSPKEVPSLLGEFIHLSQKADIRLVNIIHGKGTGALRRQVRNLLALDPRVASFYDAPPKSGGWGATVAELKPYQNEDEGEAE